MDSIKERSTRTIPVAFVLLQLLLPLVCSSGSEARGCTSGELAVNCTFFDDMCQWRSDTWKRHRYFPHYAKFNTYDYRRGSMVSSSICSTGSHIHCLEFDYEFKFQYRAEAMLSVILWEDRGGERKIWTFSNAYQGIYTARVPIQTVSDFTIILNVERPKTYTPGVGSFVTVTNIIYKQIECVTRPPDALVHNPASSKKTKPSPTPATTAAAATTTTATTTVQASTATKRPSSTTTQKVTKAVSVLASSSSPTPSAVSATQGMNNTSFSTKKSVPTDRDPLSTLAPTLKPRISSTKGMMTTGVKMKKSLTTSDPTSTQTVRKIQKESVPRTANPHVRSTASVPDVDDSIDDRHTQEVKTIVIGTVISLTVVVAFIIAVIGVKTRKPSCLFRKRSEDEKTIRPGSWHFEETEHPGSGDPDRASDALSIDPYSDSGHYSVVKDIAPSSTDNSCNTKSSLTRHQSSGDDVALEPSRGGKQSQEVETPPKSPLSMQRSSTVPKNYAANCSEDYKLLVFDKSGTESAGGNGHLYNHLDTKDIRVVKLSRQTSASKCTDKSLVKTLQSKTGEHRPLINGKPHSLARTDGDYNCLGYVDHRKEAGGGKLYEHLYDGNGDVYSQVHRDRNLIVLDGEYSHIP